MVIPKFHGARLHEITDEHLADILPACRKILLEGFGDNGANVIPAYNILQNNGRLAHQVRTLFLLYFNACLGSRTCSFPYHSEEK